MPVADTTASHPAVKFPRRVATDAAVVASQASDLRLLGWLDHVRPAGSDTVAIRSDLLGEAVALRPERLRLAMSRTARVQAGPRGGDLSAVYAGHTIDWRDNPEVHVRFSEAWCLLADDTRDATIPHREFMALDTRCAFLLRLRAAGLLRDRSLARVRYATRELVMLTGQPKVNLNLAVRDNLLPALIDIGRHAPSVSVRLDSTTHAEHAGDVTEPTRSQTRMRHVDVRFARTRAAALAA